MNLRKCHIAPGSLELAALFAIMTRLNASKSGIKNLAKAKVYNGEIALGDILEDSKNPIDIRQLFEEGQDENLIVKREGMHGLGSRDILDALDKALVRYAAEEDGCLTPQRTIWALGEMINSVVGLTPEEIKHYRSFLTDDDDSVVAEYKDWVCKVIQKAFLASHESEAIEYFNKYIENAKLYRNRTRKHWRDPSLTSGRDLTGKPREADEDFMRAIEEAANIPENGKDEFRGEMVETCGLLSDHFNYCEYKPLADAVNEKLLSDSKEMLTMVLSSDVLKNPEAKDRVANLFANLKSKNFCTTCAKEAVKNTKDFLSE